MNIYLVVEGRSTESKIYPKFIDFCFEGTMSRIKDISKVDENPHNYYLISGDGYPQIYTDILPACIQEINESQKFDYLIVSLDADELTLQERYEEFNSYLNKYEQENNLRLTANCNVQLVIQNRCFETWFMGNKAIYKENPQDEVYRKFQQYYNVKSNDPEMMGIFTGFETHSSFHLAYLKYYLKERNIYYTKKNPREVGEGYYIEECLKRKEDGHLQSLINLFELFELIKSKMI